MAEQELCPHLDTIGEVTKEDLLQKAKVGFHSFIPSALHSVLLCVCVCGCVLAMACTSYKSIYADQNKPKCVCVCNNLQLSVLFVPSSFFSCRGLASPVEQGVQTYGPVCR